MKIIANKLKDLGLIKKKIFKIKAHKIKNFFGFTLIELIVVFSVIAVLSSIGLASFVSYSRSQLLQQASSDLASAIDIAKSRTISQTIPQGVSCTGFNGYNVEIDTFNKNYTLNINCSGINTPIGSATTLPSGLNFDAQTTTTTISFSPLTNGVTGSGVVNITGYSQSRCVNIDSLGIVSQSICNPSAPTPTPTSVPGATPTPTPTSAPGVTPTATPTPTTIPTATPTPTPPPSCTEGNYICTGGNVLEKCVGGSYQFVSTCPFFCFASGFSHFCF